MKLKPLVLGFSLLAFAGAAIAQQQGMQQQQGAQRSQAQQQGQMPASELIGSKVLDRQGQELGEISDVVIDLRSGRAHAAVLEFGGVLGMGEKHYAFPISQLKPGKQRDQFVLNIDKQKLQSAEGFAKGEWPGMDDEYWGRVGGRASAGQTGTQSKRQTQGGMTLVRATELDGKKVQDNGGQDVGEIEDVILDVRSGQVRGVIIDLDDPGQVRVQAKALGEGTGERFVLRGMTAEQLRSQAKKPGQAQSQRQGGEASSGGSQPQR
jgi:sporulation protein YlmC with PRC-barrel domain